MYWLTRSVITFHAEMTTIKVMNAVSRTNQTERPSTPSRCQTLKRAIHGCFSTNCIAAVAVSKPVTSGIVTRKLATEATRAAQRTASARSSRPKASSRTPERMGSQMATLSNGMFLLLRLVSAAEEVAQVGPELPGHEADHADDHHQRVPVEVAALQGPGRAAEAADRVGAAVDEDAVDGADVAAFPERVAEQHRGTRQDVLVEPVHVVLVLEQPIDEARARADRRRDVGALEIQEPGQGH